MESVFFCDVCKFIIDGLHLFLLDGAIRYTEKYEKQFKRKQSKMELFLWGMQEIVSVF